MIDRTKLPDFLQDMPKERLKEIMEEDDKADCFDKAMDKIRGCNLNCVKACS